MIGNFDPNTQREEVYNRWGEYIGAFVLDKGYWDFVPDAGRKEKIFTPLEIQWVQKRQQELNT